MPSPSLRRATTVGALLFLTVPAAGAVGGTAFAQEVVAPPVTSPLTEPQPLSGADQNGVGANERGPYDSTRDGAPAENGVGDGGSVGQPCAGCVGRADNKNPQGQLPGPDADGNNGYECDANQGVGVTNPAHTGCTAVPTGTTTTTTPGAPPAQVPVQVTGQTPDQPVDKPAEKAAEASVDEPARPIAQPAEKPAEAPAQQPVQAGGTPVQAPTFGGGGVALAGRPAPQAAVLPAAARPVMGPVVPAAAPVAQAPVVRAQAQAPAAVVAAPTAVSTLPFTGGESAALALVGGLLVVTGGAVAVAGRRRTEPVLPA